MSTKEQIYTKIRDVLADNPKIPKSITDNVMDTILTNGKISEKDVIVLINGLGLKDE